MKLSAKETASSDPRVYTLEFEQDPTNGIHEAHLSLSAIAAANRAKFVQQYDKRNGREPGEILMQARAALLDNGMDSFCSYLQRTASEKSREDVLTATVRMDAPEASVVYLHNALQNYVGTTTHAVLNEMQSSMGNMAALTRTFETVTAEQMMGVIRDGGISVASSANPSSPTVGFIRSSFDHEVRD